METQQTTSEQAPLTFGERAVGLTFNPSGDQTVDSIKRKFATLIDMMHELRCTEVSGETKRLASIAITEMQGAQMWAVKTVTWQD